MWAAGEGVGIEQRDDPKSTLDDNGALMDVGWSQLRPRHKDGLRVVITGG